ncbi:HPr family phosphocarrier protein [Bifidobacterium sp. B4107]|uniref:HPr family phosphocarrier protein n=1 Tax=unclassified Bifidobacterium TaxID=2608897 RepID=UPI00226B70AE|nr:MULTISPECIES: HPr family phosphocarrier protein [unclassified Bifidobacterium]MCX8648254.1 HPr family phosphocarrier protein [Bifidobacterium sp. B4107]MCX8652268.1 HPr family phosphocarrier protein [Bifidobacterium sp. B4111]MCX8658699.1 HPr family phosphocarrier protein [Bifidobacterium sp. B4114]MCX8686646.1 HPr family phosphocarrier protein [Bifidobacterium sp. B4142]
MATAQRSTIITDPVGIHARPASEFSQAAASSGCKVTIAKGDGAPVEAGSILMVMSLGIAKGDQVTVTVDGDDAGSVADALVAKLTQAE